MTGVLGLHQNLFKIFYQVNFDEALVLSCASFFTLESFVGRFSSFVTKEFSSFVTKRRQTNNKNHAQNLIHDFSSLGQDIHKTCQDLRVDMPSLNSDIIRALIHNWSKTRNLTDSVLIKKSGLEPRVSKKGEIRCLACHKKPVFDSLDLFSLDELEGVAIVTSVEDSVIIQDLTCLADNSSCIDPDTLEYAAVAFAEQSLLPGSSYFVTIFGSTGPAESSPVERAYTQSMCSRFLFKHVLRFNNFLKTILVKNWVCLQKRHWKAGDFNIFRVFPIIVPPQLSGQITYTPLVVATP